MASFTDTWNLLMSLGVLACIVASLMLVYALLIRTDSFSKRVLAWTSKYILAVGLVLSLAAFVSSLVYSNVIGYEPCLLCWYARIAFYPQVVLYSMALIRKERSLLPYSLALTVIGMIITLYHSITEIVGYSPLPCSANGVSCLTRYVYEFGFITIPVMAFVGFLTLFLALLAAKKGSKISV